MYNDNNRGKQIELTSRRIDKPSFLLESQIQVKVAEKINNKGGKYEFIAFFKCTTTTQPAKIFIAAIIIINQD